MAELTEEILRSLTAEQLKQAADAAALDRADAFTALKEATKNSAEASGSTADAMRVLRERRRVADAEKRITEIKKSLGV